MKIHTVDPETQDWQWQHRQPSDARGSQLGLGEQLTAHTRFDRLNLGFQVLSEERARGAVWCTARRRSGTDRSAAKRRPQE